MKNILTSLLATLILFSAKSQSSPTIEPDFFSADDEITITYDVTGTALSTLDEAWIWMWVPAKGIDAPSNINPANSNTSATDPAKCTKTTGSEGEVYFSITLTPTTFLDADKEDIENIGMLLKGNDWSNGQTADHIVEVSDGFSIVMDNPSGSYGFYESSSDIDIDVRVSESADIDILVDDVSITNQSDATSLSTTHTIIDDGNVHTITAQANNGSETIETVFSYTITPIPATTTLPEGMVDGINYHEDNTSATLVLRAPEKEHVFLIGDFNDWSLDNDYLMNKDGEVFWLTIEDLVPGDEYLFQYLVDGDLKIADPYAEKISSQFDDGQIITENRYPGLRTYPNGLTTEAASYLQTNQTSFEWSDFTPPAKEDLVIYELLIRDFTEERTYDAVTERLDYLADLGINAIELMPVQEFEGNISWGYNPAFMFAIDKYYGTELDLKTLIDEAHKRGMAIILDIVLNHHFGRNSLVRLYNEGLYGNPTSDNPWFNTSAKHDFNVGYDMNHESEYTEAYTERVIKYWLEEYNIDGYRFDLSKGFTQRNTIGNVSLWGNYDATRIAIWKNIADIIWEDFPDAYIILEHFADNDEEEELADYGMMLWGNMNHNYINASKGRSTSLGSTYHENRGWDFPHLISYMESHDEERLMWELKKTINEHESIERAKMAAAFFLPVPGPKMIWQFGEFGYDEELNNDRLGIKPTRWEYLEETNRLKLFNQYKSLINLRTKTDYIDAEYFEWNTSPFVKTIHIDHPEVHIYIVGNFDTEAQSHTHEFSQAGTWYEYFSGRSFEVEDPSEEITMGPGEWHIYTSTLIDNYIEDQDIALNLDESNINEFVYPNPTSEFIRFSSELNGGTFKIADLSGKTIMEGEIPETQYLRLTSLQPGLYTISMNQSGKSISQKLIVR